MSIHREPTDDVLSKDYYLVVAPGYDGEPYSAIVMDGNGPLLLKSDDLPWWATGPRPLIIPGASMAEINGHHAAKDVEQWCNGRRFKCVALKVRLVAVDTPPLPLPPTPTTPDAQNV